jgi:DNA-binding MarR family transcriptional regulator
MGSGERGEAAMLNLTGEEVALLRELADHGGERTISGNKGHDGLKSLVDAKYVESYAISVDCVIYKITDAGCKALAAAAA